MPQFTKTTGPMVHVRYNGRSVDIPFADLDLAGRQDDRSVKAAVAHYLDLSANRLANYRVDRHTNGNLTVRPQAVFG